MAMRMARGIELIGGLGSDSDRALKKRENAARERKRGGDDDGMLPGLILMPRDLLISLARGTKIAGVSSWAAMMMVVIAAAPQGINGSGSSITTRVRLIKSMPRAGTTGALAAMRIALGGAMMMTMMSADLRGGNGSGSG